MAERKIRIGILGAGAMGTTHAAAYRMIETAEVVGVWSRSAKRAQGVVRVAGAEIAAEAAALFDDPTIDVIDVCVPSHAHRDVVVAALGAGKHVICEMPLALNLDDATDMIDAARAAQRLLFVGLLMRFVADYVQLRDQVNSGALGKLRSIALWRLGPYLRSDAAEAKPHCGDPSTELMTFDFDYLNWLLGPTESLSAVAAMTKDGTPGEITALLRYAGGASAVVTGNGIMPKGFPYTTGFRAVLDDGAVEHTTVLDDGIPASSLVIHAADRSPAPVRLRRPDPYERELRHCIECIRSGTASALLSAENALAALRLSVATQRSVRDGNMVRFDDALRPT